MRLPLDEEPLRIRTGALAFKFGGASLGRSSPTLAKVVRLTAPFIIGVTRGLSTLFFQSASWLDLTMRRAAPAERREFSLGGLPTVAAVGLRRRCARFTGTDPLVEERRLMACPICRASDSVHFSSSELDWPLFPSGAGPDEAFSTVLNDDVRGLL